MSRDSETTERERETAKADAEGSDEKRRLSVLLRNNEIESKWFSAFAIGKNQIDLNVSHIMHWLLLNCEIIIVFAAHANVNKNSCFISIWFYCQLHSFDLSQRCDRRQFKMSFLFCFFIFLLKKYCSFELLVCAARQQHKNHGIGSNVFIFIFKNGFFSSFIVALLHIWWELVSLLSPFDCRVTSCPSSFYVQQNDQECSEENLAL